MQQGCGLDLGIGPFLLGTTKEWKILSYHTCRKCKPDKCAVEGCDKYPQMGYNGHCTAHATKEQIDAKARKKCAVEGCDKYPRTGYNGHCMAHATKEQKDTRNDKRKK